MSFLSLFKKPATDNQSVKTLVDGVSDDAGLKATFEAMRQGSVGTVNLNGVEFHVAVGSVDSNGIIPVAIVDTSGKSMGKNKREEIAEVAAYRFKTLARVYDVGSLSRNAYNDSVSPVANNGAPSPDQLLKEVNNSVKMARYENTTAGTAKVSVAQNRNTVFGRGESFITPKADVINSTTPSTDHSNDNDKSFGPGFKRG